MIEKELQNKIDEYGLEVTIKNLCVTLLVTERPDLVLSSLDKQDISFDNISNVKTKDLGELYEFCLAYVDKIKKKEMGQYYTPNDVATFMSRLLLEEINGQEVDIVEPCCGSGNLIIPFVSTANMSWTDISDKVKLFDIDPLSIYITKTRLFADFAPKGTIVDFNDIYSIAGDFLIQKEYEINETSAIIMNPPYGRIDEPKYNCYKTNKEKEYYSLFLEACSPSAAFVSVTPHSFVCSDKFKNTREILSKLNGKVFVYDNVPSPVFCGRKHGVFNSNTSNSVRAAIGIFTNKKNTAGITVSPIIRFHADEREYVFSKSDKMIIDCKTYNNNNSWNKIPATLVPLFDKLNDNLSLGDLIKTNNKNDNEYCLCIPSSPRYFTSASTQQLNRSSKHLLTFDNIYAQAICYIVLNSSLAYSWWRFNDGGITLTTKTIMSIPLPKITKQLKEKCLERMKTLTNLENEYKVIKMNAGKPNENIKFPKEVIKENTAILFPELATQEINAFEAVHSSFFSEQLEFLAK